MTKTPKRPRDPAQLAKLIVDIATGNVKEQESTSQNEGARRGGLKGGTARAKALSARRRSEIAKKAANLRWAAEKKR